MVKIRLQINRRQNFIYKPKLIPCMVYPTAGESNRSSEMAMEHQYEEYLRATDQERYGEYMGLKNKLEQKERGKTLTVFVLGMATGSIESKASEE